MFSKPVVQRTVYVCTYSNFRYPFDTQTCPIHVKRSEKFYNQFNMMCGDSPRIKEIDTTQYNVHQYLEYNGTTSPKIVIGVKIILCRKLSYHIFNTFIPTLVLTMIAGLTLFIDFSHFEVSIMIALTSMLVSYTLYQSISSYLPHTSYMKMIDIWLFGGLIFPFFIIAILIIMDFLVIRDGDIYQVNDVMNEGEMLKSTMFMRSMQVMLLTIGSILCIIYWFVGLHHYYSSCPI